MDSVNRTVADDIKKLFLINCSGSDCVRIPGRDLIDELRASVVRNPVVDGADVMEPLSISVMIDVIGCAGSSQR